MADVKITALTAISANPVNPATFPMPMVDLLDTSQAASGSTRKVTVNQILGSGGTATLASATITGAATVGTTLGVTGASTLASVGVTGAATVGTTLLVGTNATLTNGNVIIGTSGKGIDFTATASGSGTMTSELLNDYEEGTWTIGLTFGGASTGMITSSNSGSYTKVGRKVTVTGYISLTAKGVSTGLALITGLPFTIGSAANNYSAVSLYIVSVTFADYPMGYGTVNTTNIALQEVTNAGVRTNITDADFANNSEIIFSLTYNV